MNRKTPFACLLLTQHRSLLGLSLLGFSLLAGTAAAQPANTPVPNPNDASVNAPQRTKPEGLDKKADKDDEGAVLKPGVIASVGGSAGPTVVSADTGGSAPGDAPTAVTASIRQGKGGKCDAVVINSSETDTYSVSFAVKSFDKKSGKQSGSQSFSASLPPKKTVVRSVTCAKDAGMQVVLKKGVRTASTKKKEDEGAKQPATPANSGSAARMPSGVPSGPAPVRPK